MVIDPLLALGIALGAGHVFGSMANGVRLPRVTGDIVAGMLLSPSVFNIIGAPTVQGVNVFV